MNWKCRLLIYLLFWLGFGVACSVSLTQARFDEESRSLPLLSLWTFLPFFLLMGWVAAMEAWDGEFWCHLCVSGLLLAVHGWYWFTAKSIGAWVALYWVLLIAVVIGAWGFRQYLDGLNS